MTALVVSACGGASGTSPGSSQTSARPGATTTSGSFPVAVTARFPRAQRLAQTARLVVAVRNTGAHALPDVAVTICPRSCAPSAVGGEGTSAQAFGDNVSGTDLASSSRPTWIVLRGPGACHFQCNHPGAQAGQAVTAYSNTWALGRLAPGDTARFAWTVTPVASGRHVVAWQVAGDLTGAARATVSGGSIPHGTFTIRVLTKPQKSYVTPSGQVVTTRP